MGIHYSYKSNRGARALEKKARREKKLAEKRKKNKKNQVLSKMRMIIRL